MTNQLSMEDFGKFLKKKGFIYQSSEIYGGLSGVYDYGHIGTELKKKWVDTWRSFFLRLGDNFVEIDTSIIMPENVFKASGHLDNFNDAIISIDGNVEAIRADHLIEDKLDIRAEDLSPEEMLKLISDNNLLGDKVDYTKVTIESFNMMFPVDMGPKKGTKAYLRPETAQSPFVNFKIQYELQRKKLPMGLGMIGRVYRNEIAPRNLVLRGREFEQAELQIFFNPSKINEHPEFDSIKDKTLNVVLKDNRKKENDKVSVQELLDYGLPKFYVYHMAKVQEYYETVMQLDQDIFRLIELNDKEKAFYNKYHFDIEVKLNNPNTWTEVGGIHYRTDHDLKGHETISKEKMEVLEEETKERFIPHVLELSFGLGRNIYTLLDQNYCDDKERGNILLSFPPKLSPYTLAIFPLMGKEELVTPARKLYNELLDEEFSVVYDKSGSIGKRYARQDEVGTPFCITVDYETIEEGKNKGTVTIRDRDSTEQKRIKIEEVTQIIRDLVRSKRSFEEL